MKYFLYYILILYLILIDGLNRIVQHRFSNNLKSDNGYFESERVENIEITRKSLSTLLERSWKQVVNLIPSNILSKCGDELKSATAVLVMSAITDADKDAIFSAADRDGDGSLTFLEWVEWLTYDPVTRTSTSTSTSTSTLCDSSTHQTPLTLYLGQILSHAVSSLKIISRFNTTGSELCAAYIAGGIVSGGISQEATQKILSCLNVNTQAIVLESLRLEAVSLDIKIMNSNSKSNLKAFDSSVSANNNNDASLSKNINANSFSLSIRSNPSSSSSSSSLAISSFKNQKIKSPLENQNQNQNQASATTSTSSTPSSLFHPTIQIRKADQPIITSIYNPDKPLINKDMPMLPEIVPSSNTYSDTNSDTNPKKIYTAIQLRRNSSSLIEPVTVANAKYTPQQSETKSNILPSSPPDGSGDGSRSRSRSDQVAEKLGAAYFNIMKDIEKIAFSVLHLDDKTSYSIRESIVKNFHGREDILRVAMALRAARLQHLSSPSLGSAYSFSPGYLNPGTSSSSSSSSSFSIQRQSVSSYLKYKIAQNTLQIWGPLSFQIGLGYDVPELEVYSYVVLFPRSFGSFVSWYSAFRPYAKQMLNALISSLKLSLMKDDELKLIVDSIIIQSRLKTPASAFKKMVKSAKISAQLFDLLGMRIIIKEKKKQGVFTTQKNEKISLDSLSDQLEGNESIIGKENSIVVEYVEQQGVDGYDKNIEQQPWEEEEVGTYKDDHRAFENRRLSNELEAVYRIEEILKSQCGWASDINRRKDYISNPKKSGYQSLHLTLVNIHYKLAIECQIRSLSMHSAAQASHDSYKALLLPSSSD